MKIAFIHNHNAFLPELTAYQKFFEAENIRTCIAKPGEEEITGADVLWYLMGFHTKRNHSQLTIHEYASASVPPYRKIKDLLKRKLIPRPHFRLFLNEYVRLQINIHDEIPFGYRDMGISNEFFQPKSEQAKEFDFIYTGNLSASRKLNDLLVVFDQGPMETRSILMLGKDVHDLAKTFGHCKNIIFRDAVPWDEVPGWLAKARYAVNYIPDEEPFNAQTSTKFLEYAAMQMPIISTNYYWISEFQERYGGNYFLLKEDLSNLTWERISGFPFEFPKLESWRWEEKIKDSGILEFLRQAQSKRLKT